MNTLTAVVTHLFQHSQIAAIGVDLFLKSLVILLAAGGVCLGLRRSAASTRHMVLFLAVIGLFLLPVLSGVLPAWQKPLWSVGSHAGAQNELTLTLDWAPAGPALTAATPFSTSEASPVPGSDRNFSGQQLAAHFHIVWAILALGIWLGGAGIILLCDGMARVRLRALRRNAHAIEDTDWLALLSHLGTDLRIERRVTFLQSAENLMPVTWGWIRPVILLPAKADEWSPERRRVVLLHELAHIKRRDCLTQLIARVACAIYWFNPLVWMAARRMCVERELACDDLVLNGGSKPSDYATHLVEIARSFRRVGHVAAIAMARSSQLEGRVAAIVDATRIRRSPRRLLVAVCAFGLLAFTATIAAQKSESDSPAPAIEAKPWYDSLLRGFFVEKEAQARQLTGQSLVAPEVWPYFAAGSRGDWLTATNLWIAMRKRAHQYGAKDDPSLDKAWAPILETDLAWQQFDGWTEKYVLAYGQDIIKSIPSGSIYFGGTDPGRGVITAMCESHVEAKPFYTITQNALADGAYLDYIRAMYGGTLSLPTAEDSQKAFEDYIADAVRRLKAHQLKPGEDVKVKNGGGVAASGQVAVMAINGLIVKDIFDRNPDHEFYIEESFPLDWMYPYLTPNGLIMKINRQPLDALPADIVQQDQDYWSNYLKPMLGDWLNGGTTPAEVAAFTEKVYLRHDLNGFTGDPLFAQDTWARKAYAKLRASIGGVYNWRISHAQNDEEKKQMAKAADLAFLQAFALCPDNMEADFRYVAFLMSENRRNDAIVVAQTALKFDPNYLPLQQVLNQLEKAVKRPTTD